MTDSPSSDRDELVAAYLDGEATPAERAIVEADPELMERVEILGRVVSMVSEPVTPPSPDVRRAHIAAALDASATSPKVTSLETRRKRRFSTSQMAAAAAVVVALFAVPIAISQSGSDDEDAATAGTTASSDDGASVAESAARGEVASAGAAEPADEPAEEAAEEAMADSIEDDDSFAEFESEAEAAEEPAIAEVPADEAADDGADLLRLPRLDVELAADIDGLVQQILPPPAGSRQAETDLDFVDDLTCIDVDAVAAIDPDGMVVVTGATILDNDFVEYVVVDRTVDGATVLELTVFDEACNPVLVDLIGG
ncbi:MAG: hypothetical protein AAF480_01520 [Actinomycetota bacterium]